MLEIAFTESACGALKVAQSFGKGKYHGGCVGVIIRHMDGTEPSQGEIEAEQRKAEEAQRRKWEQAVPLCGKSADVFGFSLGLSYGDIADPLDIPSRLKVSQMMFSFWNQDICKEMRSILENTSKELDEVVQRIGEGEDARIWYSSQPDELCGFYWFMDMLRNLPDGHGTIYAVKLPEHIEQEGTVRIQRGWGDVEPGDFSRYILAATPVSDGLRRHWGNTWRQLQEENAPLRACIDGMLMSAPENLYDFYITHQIDAQPECFQEAVVVGSILGKYNLKVSDGYIHQRIDRLVSAGKLKAESVPGEDEPGYWRMLRKV